MRAEKLGQLNVRAGRAQALDIIAAWRHRDLVIVGTVAMRISFRRLARKTSIIARLST
jgi:hypothetical protein